MTPIKQSKILLLPLYSNKQWKFPNNCLKGTLLFSTGPLQSSNCSKSLKTNIVCRVGERDGRFSFPTTTTVGGQEMLSSSRDILPPIC